MADQMTAGSSASAPAAPTEKKTPRHNPLTDTLTYVGEIAILLAQAIREMFRGRLNARDLMEQMEAIGVNSVAIASLTAFASGAVISLYFTPFLKQYGVSTFAGGFVALTLFRELVPVLTGVVVASRAGSAIAAEIGTMKVTEQIDALRSLAVSPIQYLVVPRVIAAVVTLPLVCAIADMAGLFGGFLVYVYLEGEPPVSFPNSIQQFVIPSDFYLGLAKTVAFGLILALVGCHQGLKTRGGATEVGQATRNTVVLSIVLIYITNFFLAYAMFAGNITF